MASSLQHIALIMDGNRRWAKEKKETLNFGYLKGVNSLRKIIEYFVVQKIPYLTLFVFSTENWKRPQKEIGNIFKILEKSILRYESVIQSQDVKVEIMGDLDSLPQEVQSSFQKLVLKTQKNTGLHLIMAVNYGGRQEIVSGINRFLKTHSEKNEITEKDFASFLQSSLYPPPDLVIRTGGVQRISNFCLWSSAYSEFYFSDCMWPDFNVEELKKAIQFYEKSNRRFGGS